MNKYISTSTGNTLECKPNMFVWRGQFFSGLVDIENNTLYDNPDDSFASVVGIESSLEKGLIKQIN